jgi:hypothetical protein
MFRSTLALGFFTVACTPDTSTVGQRITCETDPDSGVILRCQPGEGDGSPDTCEDVDEDGDGLPGDDFGDGTILRRTGTDDDKDGDGIPNAIDCDQQTGEDDDDADLPYNFDMRLGKTYRPIADAFAEKGGQPAEVLSIEMTGSTWRLAELLAGTAFTVDQADCDHAGNKDTGRDRIVLRWRNADGTVDSDHMTLRYCRD